MELRNGSVEVVGDRELRGALTREKRLERIEERGIIVDEQDANP
jgi:hypothetical protein